MIFLELFFFHFLFIDSLKYKKKKRLFEERKKMRWETYYHNNESSYWCKAYMPHYPHSCLLLRLESMNKIIIMNFHKIWTFSCIAKAHTHIHVNVIAKLTLSEQKEWLKNEWIEGKRAAYYVLWCTRTHKKLLYWEWMCERNERKRLILPKKKRKKNNHVEHNILEWDVNV